MKIFMTISLLFLLHIDCEAQSIQLPIHDLTANSDLNRDFKTFDPNYQRKKDERLKTIRSLAKEVFALETKGTPTACSHQILFELISMIVSSADFNTIDVRINDLRSSLIDSAIQSKADQIDPVDSSFGACFTEWFLKVNKTYGYLEKAARADDAPRPLPGFLDKVNTPEKLAGYLNAIAVSDVAKTGIDHERELNDITSTLAQMIIRGRPRHYLVDTALKAALMDIILNKIRNRSTGWWGESYIRNGRREYVDDLSITFHMVSYLRGSVLEMNKVVATTLAVKDLDYPVGWLWHGDYWNHNNMDVVTMFMLGWPDASVEQRRHIRVEIRKMLSWCLTKSLQTDGSFKAIIADGSIEEAEIYGVDFLYLIGYFDPSKCFWTDESFPQASAVRERILRFVKKHEKSGGAGGGDYKDIHEELGGRN
jgi:hypothetical protein